MRQFLFAALGFLFSMAGEAQAAEVQPFVRGSYTALIKEHSGRPLVVHFWSLTCAPCLLELPRWRELAEQHKDFDLVLVSTDPLERSSDMEKRLQKMGLDFVPNFAFADSFTDRLYFEVDKTWHGELPRTSLVGRDGHMESLLGAADEKDVLAWLDRQKNTP